MFNLVELQKQLAQKAVQAKEIVDRAEKAEGGGRPMTPDEITIFDRLTDEINTIKANIASVEAHMRRADERDKLIKDLETPQRQVPPSPVAAAGGGVGFGRLVPASARRTGTLRAFIRRDGETEDERDFRAYKAGLWLRATVFNDQRAAAKATSLGMGPDIRNAMSGGSNPDGGFLVPEEFSRAIIDLRELYGVFRQNCRVWPMGGDTLDIPRRAGGVTIGPIGENPSSAISQSSPTFNMVKLVAKKAGGLTLLSSEIAEDAVIDLADWVASEFAYGFALFEDQCAYLGDGTSTYLGITGLKALFTGSGVRVGAVDAASGHNTMATIDNADITKCMSALPQYAQPNAKFFCSSVFADAVFSRLMAVAGGNNVMTLKDGTGTRTRGTYLGYPIVISQVMETSTGTINGSPYLFFGDMSKSSSIGDRRQVRVFTSADRYMDTDQIGIRGTERFDIVHNDVGDTTAAGPLVALLGKT